MLPNLLCTCAFNVNCLFIDVSDNENCSFIDVNGNVNCSFVVVADNVNCVESDHVMCVV